MSKGLKFYLSKALRKFLNPPAIRDSKLDKTVAVWNNSSIDTSTIDKYTYISDHTLISSATIGAYNSISSYCQIGGAGHPLDFVSTSPVFTTGRNAMGHHFAKHEFDPYKQTVIGNDVWIGTHCLIKSGVKIADGAVIGMGSVVTKDVGPYEIWAGNPAKLIRKRFDDDTIARLLEIKWWTWSDDKVKQFAEYFDEPSKLFEKIDECGGEA